MTGFTIGEDKYLEHYGILRRSGRYPWGSGKDAEERSRGFLGMVSELRKQGLSDPDIARSFNMTTTELRATTSIARNQRRSADIAMAQRLKDKGYSNVAIAQRMGLPGESSVRALLEPGARARTDKLQAVADGLKDQVTNRGYIDVGVGAERHLDVSRTQLDTALSMLKSEGYSVVKMQVNQLGTGNKTTVKVLAPPGKTEKEHYVELVKNNSLIQPLRINQMDDGKYTDIKPPLSISSKRVDVKFAEDGGTHADGVVYVRPGVNDVSLGGARYAQVRIAVDGTHYLKGMAVYKDDLPEGVDLQFNTNKSKTVGKMGAMKAMKDDPEDPFGATTRQILGHDNKPKSVMNIVNEEGDWSRWSKNLASQMLSKQKPSLADEQLGKTYADKKRELDGIMSLTNPAVRRKLLATYADSADSSSVHLQAAALPRQATQVILPVKSLRDTEIYAPNFRDGERVALVRYPHGGTFEIPELTVNNRNPEASSLLGRNAKDAVGIHPKVAERLSGADFDGDTVLVIPNNAGRIKSKPALESLKHFDPKVAYAPHDGMRTIDGGVYNATTRKTEFPPGTKPSGRAKGVEMGKVSNLITDMTIKGANDNEIARAVRHSMVVIDAEKHGLNYRQSYVDNGIAQLKKRYQGGADKGASTLISRTSSELRVPKRKQSFNINPDTGEKVYKYTGEGYVKRKTLKDGTVRERFVPNTTKSTKGAEAKNAHTLSSGTPIEEIYANHANRLKALANQARKEMVATKSIPYSPSAKAVYSNEVSSLNRKLDLALRNAPVERQAQIVANTTVKQKRLANPDMTAEELKKISGKALIDARARLGAHKTLVDITDREWEAIQAGAITNNKLSQILDNSDLDKVKQLATPRQASVMTTSKQSHARQLLAAGRTPSEVADIIGVPISTLTSSLNRKDA